MRSAPRLRPHPSNPFCFHSRAPARACHLPPPPPPAPPRVQACSLSLMASETNSLCIFFPSLCAPFICDHTLTPGTCANTPPLLLKECSKNRTTERAFSELPEYPQQTHHSKRLFSIPEVAEEDGEPCEFLHKQGLGDSSRVRTGLARESRPARPCRGHEALHGSWYPAKPRGPQAEDFIFEDRGCRFSRSATRSPDSGLDCGSEEEEMRFSFRSPTAQCSPGPGPCPCRRSLRPLLARRRTLTRQSSIEEDFGEPVEPGDVVRSDEPHPSPERSTPSKYGWDEPTGREDFRDAWKKTIKMPDSRAIARQAQPPPRVADGPLVCEVNLPLTSACQTNPFSFFHLLSLFWCPSRALSPLALSRFSMHF